MAFALVGVGGVAVTVIAFVTGVVGSKLQALKGRCVFYWPLIGIATVVGAFLLGVYISGSGMAT